MNDQQRLVVIGAGGFGREVFCWAADAAESGSLPKSIAFVDDNPDALGGFSYPVPWISSLADYLPAKGDVCLVTIGDPEAKRRITQTLRAKGARFATLIHPTAVVARSATLGEGCIVCPQAMISADAQVGEFVIVNGLSSVGHDVKLGAYSTLSAHVDITGAVVVGEMAFFGTGAKVVPRITIGQGAKIGAGTVVMRSVPDGATVYAVPARRL